MLGGLSHDLLKQTRTLVCLLDLTPSCLLLLESRNVSLCFWHNFVAHLFAQGILAFWIWTSSVLRRSLKSEWIAFYSHTQPQPAPNKAASSSLSVHNSDLFVCTIIVRLCRRLSALISVLSAATVWIIGEADFCQAAAKRFEFPQQSPVASTPFVYPLVTFGIFFFLYFYMPSFPLLSKPKRNDSDCKTSLPLHCGRLLPGGCSFLNSHIH